ncbi:hypothetical protein RHMOL_Rhmol10G0029300 [Rhododendron molle]|uniref:Uncharacterized protein n=1 Tax=Rhododendron molle TaxID=49168 RepID=A0ACC0LY78_RHOML|nr:hypothetical protein RHMOL_Rhmol10G0029300 [Rhododendron molle]
MRDDEIKEEKRTKFSREIFSLLLSDASLETLMKADGRLVLCSSSKIAIEFLCLELLPSCGRERERDLQREARKERSWVRFLCSLFCRKEKQTLEVGKKDRGHFCLKIGLKMTCNRHMLLSIQRHNRILTEGLPLPGFGS